MGLRWDAIDFERNLLTIKYTVTEAVVDGKYEVVEKARTKTKSSRRTLPLVLPFASLLQEMRKEQEKNRDACGKAYCTKYLDFVYVNELGERIKPGYISSRFPVLLEENGLRRIRFHDLRHPYVKHTTKKFNSEKQKTQATKMDLIAWGFCFCIVSYSKRSWTL